MSLQLSDPRSGIDYSFSDEQTYVAHDHADLMQSESEERGCYRADGTKGDAETNYYASLAEIAVSRVYGIHLTWGINDYGPNGRPDLTWEGRGFHVKHSLSPDYNLIFREHRDRDKMLRPDDVFLYVTGDDHDPGMTIRGWWCCDWPEFKKRPSWRTDPAKGRPGIERLWLVMQDEFNPAESLHSEIR